MKSGFTIKKLYPILNQKNKDVIFFYHSYIRNYSKKINSSIIPPTFTYIKKIYDEIHSKKKKINKNTRSLLNLFDIINEQNDDYTYCKCIMFMIIYFNLLEYIYFNDINFMRVFISFIHGSEINHSIIYPISNYNVLIIPNSEYQNSNYNLESLFVSLLNNDIEKFRQIFKKMRNDIDFMSHKPKIIQKKDEEKLILLNSNLEKEFLARKS